MVHALLCRRLSPVAVGFAIAVAFGCLTACGGGGGSNDAWARCEPQACDLADAVPLSDLHAWTGEFPFSADLGPLEPAELVASLRRACPECTTMEWSLTAEGQTWSKVQGMSTSLPVTVAAVGVDVAGTPRVFLRAQTDLVVTVDAAGLQEAQDLGTSGSPWNLPNLAWVISL